MVRDLQGAAYRSGCLDTGYRGKEDLELGCVPWFSPYTFFKFLFIYVFIFEAMFFE